MSDRGQNGTLITLALAILLGAHPCVAQTITDGKVDYRLDEMTVVSTRSESVLRRAAAATTVLTRSSLEQLPVGSLAEALTFVPGLNFVDRGDPGVSPVAIVRGFYGGGEAEYILLTVDGIPANDTRTGLIDWNQIPLSHIERIEIHRGGASTLYGDEALGAVVNVVTRTTSTLPTSSSLLLGQNGRRVLNADRADRLGRGEVAFRVHGQTSDGFRDRSGSKDVNLRASFKQQIGFGLETYTTWGFHWLDRHNPGPLTEAQVAGNRNGVNPKFLEDRRSRGRLDGNAGFVAQTGGYGKLRVDAGIRFTSETETETLLLTPDFGDTQFKDETEWAAWLRMTQEIQLGPSRWTMGAESELGRYRTGRFRDRSKAAILSDGEGRRLSAGLFAEGQLALHDRLLVTIGGRLDGIHDRFHPESAANETRSYNRWTPRLGLNFEYARSQKDTRGNVYVSWSRAYKAPTLDQLYDQRRIDLGPDGKVGFSNSELRAQRSKTIEAGLYQSVRLVTDAVYGEASVSVYQTDLSDEIDFDLSTLKYGNIQKSRHRGVETSASLYILPSVSISQKLDWCDVRFRSGSSEGNRLKNIPVWTASQYVHSYFGRIRYTLARRVTGSVYLDDANRISLSSYARWDAKAKWKARSISLHLSVYNLTDRTYNATGYALFDPVAFRNVTFLYPAEGRSIRAGVEYLF